MTTEIGETYRQAGSKFEQLRAGVCASACAYSFLGGTDRSLLDGSMIGFHQFHWEQSPELGISPAISEASGISQAQQVMGNLAAYLVEMGIDARLLQVASTASPDQIVTLSEDQLVQLHVVTPMGFGVWRMTPVEEGIVVSADRQDAASLERKIAFSCAAETRSPFFMIEVEKPVVWANGPWKSLTKQDFESEI